MPADDLVLNVRQIANYSPPVTSALGSDLLLLQRGGLGGPYISIDAADFVATALAAPGGSMSLGGNLTIGGALTGQSAQFFNASVLNIFSAASANITSLAISLGTLNGCPIATVSLTDLLAMGGAPNFSPVFGGEPRAPTPPSSSHSSRLATTAFVHRNSIEYIDGLLAEQPFVFTFNGRSGNVVLTAADIAGAGGEFFDNVVLTGIPTAPTAPPGTDTTQIATTEFVTDAVANLPYAPINSPQFTGFPSGPTAPLGSSTGQLATTAFVQDAITAGTAGVASFNTRTGAVVLTGGDITGAGGALLASPAFTGSPTAPTAAPGTNSTVLATTAFVEAAIGGVGVASFNGRTGAVVLSTADITGAGGAPSASPVFTGIPAAPTAAPATSTTQLATTAFVMAALASGGVTSFNTRTGAITLLASDISAAGGAVLASPVFTGIPTAPTAAPTVTTNQLATCAFVAAAVANSVSSFNGRSGAITLTTADITAAGGAPLASPHFTGTPIAPTAAPGDNSTTLATTAYVTAALAAGSVASFNGRSGTVTLTGADVSGAGGALVASPTFTGTPAAPTPSAGTNSTQLATTAYVMNALSAGGGVLSFNGRAGAITLTTADVTSALPASTATPLMNGTGAAGSANAWARGDHVHPSDTSRLALTGGTLTGTLNGTAANFLSASAGVLIEPFVNIQATATTTTPGLYLATQAGANIASFAWNPVSNAVVGAFGAAYWLIDTNGMFNVSGATAYKPGGGSWTAPASDERVKTIERDYDKGLDEVLALRPVVYTFKGNDTPTADVNDAVRGRDAPKPRVGVAPFPASPHYQVALDQTEFVGFIAQELEVACPGMVTKVPGFIDGQAVADLRQVNISNLVYMLVNAVKALTARLEALEAT